MFYQKEMKPFDWILYGAYGYTGQLLAEEAVHRGHHPLLAGRSAEKLKPIADRLGLDWQAVDLGNTAGLVQLLTQARVVLHAAGPFTYTGAPMVQACLQARTHYMDITGEVPYMESVFSWDEKANQSGIILLTGAGLDVVPSDCLAVYVAQKVPGAVWLETAIHSTGGSSSGTKRSSLEMVARGGLERRNGRLVPLRLGSGVKKIRFLDKERTVMSAPWGDLATAYRSTGIPNIRCFLAVPSRYVRLVKYASPVAGALLSFLPVRQAISQWMKNTQAPGEEARQHGHTSLCARAASPDGRFFEAWMETLSGYTLTALTGVRLVEKVLASDLHGACSPAQAFGPDFVLEIEGTRRYDSLPPGS